jgi:protein-L-isoaspartate(D-aspartate) O-methyltransferase
LAKTELVSQATCWWESYAGSSKAARRERATAFSTYIAYCGTCEVEGDVVVHRGFAYRDTGNAWAMQALGPENLVAAARAAGVEDEGVLVALRRVPRALFVPPSQIDRAYEDVPLPIAHGQVTTQPSLVAKMVEALALTGSERVLEIGTGYGWQTALLASLADVVWSVERWPDLAEAARANLERYGVRNVEVAVGDGSRGLAEQAPFEAILVSAAFPRVPPPLAEQLAPGGRLVQPIGRGGNEDVVLFERRGDRLDPVRSLTAAHFVPLVGRHGFQT